MIGRHLNAWLKRLRPEDSNKPPDSGVSETTSGSAHSAHQEVLGQIAEAVKSEQTSFRLHAPKGLKAVPKEIADVPVTELSIWSPSSREADTLDISALSSLEALEVLRVSGSAHIDLEHLYKAPKLTRLEFLIEAHVKNLRLLERLPAFRSMEFSGVDFVSENDEPSVLHDLSEVRRLRELCLPECNFDDPANLSRFSQLETLKLTGVTVQDPRSQTSDYGIAFDLNALLPLTRLRELDLYDANVEDFSLLAEFPNLRSVNVGRNRSLDPSILAKMPDLEEIYLADVEVQDLSVLSALAGLKTLWAPSEPVRKEIGWLKGLPQLSVLALAVGGSDLSPLRHLTKLKTLFLNVHDSQDLSIVSELQQLDRLEIWGPNVRDVSALASLTELKSLRLHSTSVLDLGPVQHVEDLLVTGPSA